MSADLLQTVVAAARRAARDREDRVGREALAARARARPAGERRFAASLGLPGIRIIAECKRRSPSKGILRQTYDPVAIAAGYEAHGAAAISVLTEPTFFDGSLADLESVRQQVQVPLLRKDFIVTDYQVLEASACGADAVLLIAAALDGPALRQLIEAAGTSGLEALVEAHDRRDLDRALDAGATIVGINSRNLRTLQVDPQVLDTLGPMIPEGVMAVAESGLRTAADLARLTRLRYDAFLIGERFMTAPDPGEALEGLRREAERVVGTS